ncbi:MAG: Bax inhibitor-1/YccA family protein [Termitinemataceae bacterium]|nr:MAG: Bax inhibitor-1/YccA family protein [Termitinemataceae bacterium]
MEYDMFAAEGSKTVDVQKSFITGVYLWMAFALGVTGITAMFAVSTNIFEFIFSIPFAPIILGVAELALVAVLSAKINSLSAVAATLMFLIYSTLTGLSLSVIFLVYTGTSIATIFFVSAGMFALMSAFGFATKADLTKMGSILMMVLIGIIIASVVNFFLGSAPLYFIISFVSVIVFAGLTVYDAQKLKAISVSGDFDTARKQSVIGALSLYLDFINLFLSMLRLFGSRK